MCVCVCVCVCVQKQLLGIYFQVWKWHCFFVLRNVKFLNIVIFSNHVEVGHVTFHYHTLWEIMSFATNSSCELVAKDTIFHDDKFMHLHANIQEIKWCLVLCSFSSSLGHVIPNLKVYLKSLKLQPKAQK